MPGINALKMANFDWTFRLNSIWTNCPHDVAELNREIRAEILWQFDRMRDDESAASPLGWVIKGQGGSGKTHLLSALREAVAERNGGFVLVDMTDVHDFWKTVLHGYIRSLEKTLVMDRQQFQTLLEHLVSVAGISSKPRESIDGLASESDSGLVSWTDSLLGSLRRKLGSEVAICSQDSIRAMVLLTSDEIRNYNLGLGWLQGLGIDEEEKNRFGFMLQEPTPREIVNGLSWAMSIKSPVILALDQLDALVNQRRLLVGLAPSEEVTEERALAVSIIEGIGGGLSALIDQTRRTLIVVSCQDKTWETLQETALSSHLDRFNQPRVLRPVPRGDLARKIVERRLRNVHESLGSPPEYSSWPFRPEAFRTAEGLTPREVLQRCENHKLACLRSNQVKEFFTFAPQKKPEEQIGGSHDYPELDAEYETLMHQVDLRELLHKDNEDKLGTHFQKAFACLVREHPERTEIDFLVEGDIAPKRSCQSTHLRIRMVYLNENDREEHFCLRILQQTNARAYQNRLDAAMTASGIDRNLDFRRLVIVRTLGSNPIPSGEKTKRLTNKFEKNGGRFLQPAEGELRRIVAMSEFADKNHPDFQDWLAARKPLSRLRLVEEFIPPLYLDAGEGPKVENTTNKGRNENGGKPSEGTATKSEAEGTSGGPEISVGRRVIGGRAQEHVKIPVMAFTKHVAVLAGAGSGKTVLLKRIVEEAALIGIPSIVVDCQNDLAALGDAWPEHPDKWDVQDEQRAKSYFEQTEVIIWTPGKQMGNPMRFEPLPDLAGLADDPDALKEAIDMALASLQELVATGTSATAKNKKGVLAAALEYFASIRGNALESFIDLLSDLPSDAGGGISDSARLACQMADNLKAELRLNPLLRSGGSSLDPAVLFGRDAPSGKTRISVLSFIALPVLSMQQQFLNQMAMSLFAWIKKNPTVEDGGLRGLLVIDEARDFVPSGRSTPCKLALSRLTAQARKFGLGLIFATQYPMDIDVSITGNCSNQFYGRANAPRAIEILREQLKLRGGSGQDVPTLSPGEFYVSSPDAFDAPLKVRVPMCLSHHPPNPLDESAILQRARSRRSQR